MKRKPRITREDVFDAADAVLLRRGKRPTVQNVLTTLKRGSANTVNKYLNEYWRSLAARISGTAQRRRRLLDLIGELLELVK